MACRTRGCTADDLELHGQRTASERTSVFPFTQNSCGSGTQHTVRLNVQPWSTASRTMIFFLQRFSVELQKEKFSFLIICLDYLYWKTAITQSSKLDLGSSSKNLAPFFLFGLCLTAVFLNNFHLSVRLDNWRPFVIDCQTQERKNTVNNNNKKKLSV